ncbi:MAG: hypothetical protein PHY12_08370 [Eubacteriales bacterium]|nr:hypothetical protein [Eubacteriales bacterium]
MALGKVAEAQNVTPQAVRRAYERGVRHLCHNLRLRAAWLDRETDWHRHVSLEQYNRTWTSSTEALVFWRENQYRAILPDMGANPT